MKKIVFSLFAEGYKGFKELFHIQNAAYSGTDFSPSFYVKFSRDRQIEYEGLFVMLKMFKLRDFTFSPFTTSIPIILFSFWRTKFSSAACPFLK